MKPSILIIISGGVLEEVVSDHDVDVHLMDIDNIKAGESPDCSSAESCVDVVTPEEFNERLIYKP